MCRGQHIAGVCVVYSREDTLQTHQRVWKFFQQSKVVSFVVKTGTVAVLGLLSVGAPLSTSMPGVQTGALSGCPGIDHTYTVARGATSSVLATHRQTNTRELALHEQSVDSNTTYTNQKDCAPAGRKSSSERAVESLDIVSSSHVTLLSSVSAPTTVPVGHENVFPYGACTWWADQRYYQLHGVYVPWTSGANAWQWTDRAYQFGWSVSSQPQVGSIIDLQPGVQGAYGNGHVAVVERVLANGQVVASSMSWGANPMAVTYWQFRPGPGVTFINL
jgi:surface antigen